MLVCAIGNGDKETIYDELLQMAFRYAKIRITAQNSNSKQVDAELIQDKIDNIRQKIGKFRTIKANCTNIEKSTKDIRDTSKSLEDEINDELDSVDRSLENGKEMKN